MAKPKSDTPPLKMVVERGPRLAPATPDDAERLDTWRLGSQVNVSFVRNGSRPMERKWFAILGLVVNQCDVPWTNKEAASEAVKLALGVVNYGKTVNGKFMQWPKSLTELTDPELDDAVRDMLDLIHKMTGVDPETLKKEAADVGGDTEQDSSGEPHPSDDGSGNSSVSPKEPAADNSAQQSGPEAGAPTEDALSIDDEGQHTAETAPASEPDDNDKAKIRRMLMEECISNMLRDAVSEPKAERAAKIDKAAAIWKGELLDHHGFVDKVAETARRIIDKPAEQQKAREYLLAKVV